MPGKRHSCGNSGIPEIESIGKFKRELDLIKYPSQFCITEKQQMLAWICKICLRGSNLTIQQASPINSAMCNSSMIQFSILFCMTFVRLSVLNNFLEILSLKCVFVWCPELSVVIQTGQKTFMHFRRWIFPIYSTGYTLLQWSSISQSLPEDLIWRMVPARNKMQGSCLANSCIVNSSFCRQF